MSSSRIPNSSPPKRATVVAGADRLLESRRGRGQKLVAHLVAEAVVDELETIQVQRQDRIQCAGVPAQPLAGLLQPVQEQDAIRLPGQRVVQRAVPDVVVDQLPVQCVAQHVGEGLDEVDIAGLELPGRGGVQPKHRERAAAALDQYSSGTPSTAPSANAASSTRTRSASSGCNWRAHMSRSAHHSCAVKPRIVSICGLT